MSSGKLPHTPLAYFTQNGLIYGHLQYDLQEGSIRIGLQSVVTEVMCVTYEPDLASSCPHMDHYDRTGKILKLASVPYMDHWRQ